MLLVLCSVICTDLRTNSEFYCVNHYLSHYRPEVPRGFQEVKVSRLRDNGPIWW